MYSRRIHRWVFELITKFYPRFYFRRHDPIVRPPRKPIHLEIDLLDRRESPTNVSPVGPGSAWLAPFLSAAETLPALMQTSQASVLNHPFSANDAGGHVNPARIANRSPAPSEETSNGRAGSYGTGDDGAAASAAPTPMPWHFAAEAFAVNLNPVASGQALVEDPFTLDALLQSKPPSRLSFPPNIPSPLVGEGAGGGSGSSSTGGGGGSSSAESGQGGGASFGGASAQGIPFGSASSQDQAAGGVNPLLAPSAPGFHGSGSPGNSGNPAQPNPGNPHGHHHNKDAFYVLDANKAIVVTPGTADNEFSNTSMDLRMQVSAATVSSYSWDYSGAPDTTGVSGGSTYNLTFSWTSFTGAARSETIIAKETPSGGSQVTQTLTFLVAGTNSPAWSTIPTSSSTWSTFPVITPDTVSTMQASQCCGSYADLGLTAGDVQYSHSLPTYNPGVPSLGLVYNSIAANTLPIFITHYQIDPTKAVPPTVSAQLTFNSVQGTTVYYDTSHLNPGDIMQIPLQGDATGQSTGRYSWSISVTANYNPNPVTSTWSGNVDIVNSSSSPFGAGWSLNNLSRIWSQTGGVMLELPGGLSLWFKNGQTAGSFVTPPGDTSTLTQNQTTLVYTRTLKDGTKINFNSSGYQTSIVDTNGNTLTFGYNGSNLLTSLTDFNSLVTTLAYNGSNKLTSITDPASRVTTLAYNTGNTQLTSITDPDSAVWGYGYDSANRLTTLTDPRSKVTTYAYSTGRVTTVTRADNSTALLTALQLQGIPASGTGTQTNPATPVLAAGATAAYTDPNNNIWNTRMDWLGFGEPTQQADPLGDLANAYRDANGFPYVMADALSRRTREFFDTLENPTKTVFADDNYQQATYNGFSEPLTITDELGNVTTYGYDTNGNNTQITDALSHTTTMSYTTHGFLSTVIDPNSHTTTYGYDSRSRQTSITDALNHTATMAYDSASDMTGQTDMRGNATTYTFDAEGRLLTTTLPGTPTSTTTNTYDAAGNLITTTDALGHVSTLAYDNLNREISSTDPLSHTTTYGYDGAGNQTTVTDPLSHITTYAFDAANRLTAVTDPNSHTTSYGYDAAGERTSLTDALSHTITYGYSNRSWLIGTTDPNSNVINNSYNAAGDLSTVTKTDTSGQLTALTPEIMTYTYDNAHRKTTMVDPQSLTTSYGYDAANNQTTVTDPLSHVTTSTFDADNHLSTVIDALSHTVTYGYDNNGNQVTVTDALGRTTSYAYDAQNRLTTVTDPLTGVTTYAYDQASRKTSITDAVGNTTTYGYDNANRLTTVSDPNSHTTTYAYDNANRLTSVTDRNGRQITYAYDSAGNKTGETWVSGSYTATYTYDAANRLTVEQDTFSKYTLGYDIANRLTSVDNLGTPNAPRLTLTYAYDHFNNRASITDNFSSGTMTMGYDLDDRLSSVSLLATGFMGKNPNVALAYDSSSRLSSLTRIQITGGSTVTSTYGYDNANRLTGITHKSSAPATLMTLTYGYDNANQLTSSNGPEGSITYTYDNDGQLTNVGNARTETYTYDKEGNRTMTGYTTGTGNRLTGDGTYTYSYDNDGNMTGRTRTSDGQVTTFTWDFRNRLTEVLIKTSAGVTVQDDKFTYDVENRRIGKNTLSGGQSWTGYVDANPYADFNSGGSLTYRYLYGNSIDFLLGRVDTSGNAMWYLRDNIGSVRENVNASGTVLDSITYDSYGNILSESSPSSGDRFKYTSREWDSEIAQYYYRARYYRPGIGRFQSEDPLGFNAGDSNLYRYVRNSVTANIDPTGLYHKDLGLKEYFAPILDKLVKLYGDTTWFKALVAVNINVLELLSKLADMFSIRTGFSTERPVGVHCIKITKIYPPRLVVKGAAGSADVPTGFEVGLTIKGVEVKVGGSIMVKVNEDHIVHNCPGRTGEISDRASWKYRIELSIKLKVLAGGELTGIVIDNDTWDHWPAG